MGLRFSQLQRFIIIGSLAYQTSAVAQDRTPAEIGEATGTTATAPAKPKFTESVKDSVEEFKKHQNDNLAEACSDCQYDWEKHSTTCKNTKPHHVQRCSINLWAQASGNRAGYSACHEYFITKDGKLGPMAKTIMDEMAAKIEASGFDPHMGFLRDNEALFQQPDESGAMKKLCPGFNNFDYLTRMEFYLFLMENIAYRETSCSKTPAVNPHGSTTPAVCAFQMEGSPKVRKTNRGAIPNCQGSLAYIKSSTGCAKCATDIMLGTLQNPKYPQSPFGNMEDGNEDKVNHVYWESMNPALPKTVAKWRKKHSAEKATPHQGVLDDITYFPGCNEDPFQKAKK